MRVAAVVVMVLGLVAGWLPAVAAQMADGAFIAGAQRQFATTDVPERGSGFLQFTIHVLPSDAQAEEQFPGAVARLREYFAGMAPGTVTLAPASAGGVGDQSQAFAGTARVEGVDVVLAVIAWRDGPLIYTAASVGMAGDQVAELEPIIQRVADRHYTDAPVRRDRVTGMRTGGAWDLLPNLDDLPPGFALQREIPLTPRVDATPAP
ncbi:MAG: hypothetical protein KC442_10605 [Thermomicrobiales bacterium]|nr:hypothetical protein [Thermomicrobiales bacterium]